ncbi:MAG: VOC family protein [Kofleriaceae bacterium]
MTSTPEKPATAPAPPPANQPGTVGWFDLMTTSPKDAYRFYGRLFTWSFELTGPDTGGYAMAMSAGRPAAGIGGLPPDAPQRSTWSVYFISADADATAARIKEHGGAVVMGPHDVPGQGRMIVATDPGGATFGVWQPGGHPGAGARDEHGAMAWCEVNTRDSARARAFYAAVFDLEPRKLAAPGIEYWTLHRGDLTVAGVLQMDGHWPAEVPEHWMPYFQLTDVDGALEEIAALGGTVCVPPFDSPYGRIAVLGDPQGATFSVMTPPPPPPEPAA